MEVRFGAGVTVIDSPGNRQVHQVSKNITTSLCATNRTPIEILGQFDVQFICGGHSDHGHCLVAENIA